MKNYPPGVNDEDIARYFSDFADESPAYERYIERFRWDASTEYKKSMADGDEPCTFGEFMSWQEQPLDFQTFMEELEEDLTIQAAEARAEYLRDTHDDRYWIEN